MEIEVPIDGEAKERLLAEISEAFGDLPVPIRRNLIRHLHSVDRPGEEQIRQELTGKRWQDLTSEFLGGRLFSFMYLSPEAYRYYLPALLVRAVEETAEDSDLVHSVVYHLLPSFWSLYYQGDDRDLRAKQDAFSPRQYLAVCAFLGYILDHRNGPRYLAAQALRWGWNAMECPALEASRKYFEPFFSYSYAEPDDLELAALFQHIHTAFADNPYPGDHNLCGSDQGDEPAEYAMEFRGHKWQSVHPDFLDYNYPCTSFFSDAALCYYMPALLLADICEDPPTWGMAHRLMPDCERPDMFEWQAGRWSGLTEEQRAVVREYLTIAANRDEDRDYDTQQDARTAMEYWSGTPYEDLLARQPSVFEAEVVFLTSEEAGRQVGAFDGFLCEIHIEESVAECRLGFPVRQEGARRGFVRPGETARATLAFRRVEPIVPHVAPGMTFEIWRLSRKVGDGRVTGPVF